MTEHPNAAVVRSAYEAVERGDMAAFAAALDDDIVWHESMPGFEGDYHGRDGVLAFLGRMFAETGIEVKRPHAPPRPRRRQPRRRPPRGHDDPR